MTLATMLAGTSDMRWNTPNVRSSVTCDTTVEINETEAYLINFTLEGWAITCRIRAYSDWSDDQMWESGGGAPGPGPGGSRSAPDPPGAGPRGANRGLWGDF